MTQFCVPMPRSLWVAASDRTSSLEFHSNKQESLVVVGPDAAAAVVQCGSLSVESIEPCPLKDFGLPLCPRGL